MNSDQKLLITSLNIDLDCLDDIRADYDDYQSSELTVYEKGRLGVILQGIKDVQSAMLSLKLEIGMPE